MNLLESIYYYFYLRRRRRFESRAAQRAAREFQESFSCKIISVGNITTGGTGKTPTVQWVARRLQERGARVAVVARGYGGKLSQTGALVSDGKHILLDAEQAGDEPVLHTRALPGIPVIIGRDRLAAVRRAVTESGADVVVLDDAFQYWSLARDLDIVLLDARRPLDNGRLLPCGRLREPPTALRRADALLLTRSDLATAAQRRETRERVARYTSVPCFEASHAPVALRDASRGVLRKLDELRAMPVYALSALADNNAFAATLRACGATVVGQAARRDHYRWQVAEVKEIARQAQLAGAGALVTTEKDAVKIEESWTQPLPLWSLGIELKVTNETDLLDLIRAKVLAG